MTNQKAAHDQAGDDAMTNEQERYRVELEKLIYRLADSVEEAERLISEAQKKAYQPAPTK